MIAVSSRWLSSRFVSTIGFLLPLPYNLLLLLPHFFCVPQCGYLPPFPPRNLASLARQFWTVIFLPHLGGPMFFADATSRPSPSRHAILSFALFLTHFSLGGAFACSPSFSPFALAVLERTTKPTAFSCARLNLQLYLNFLLSYTRKLLRFFLPLLHFRVFVTLVLLPSRDFPRTCLFVHTSTFSRNTAVLFSSVPLPLPRCGLSSCSFL